MKTAISFDFDSTLSKEHIQDYAYSLKDKFELWIITSRFNDDRAPNKDWNKEVYEVADSLGIPKKRIVFTNLDPKYYSIQKLLNRGVNLVVHVDDDRIEVDWINKERNGCVAYCTWSNSDWKELAYQRLKEFML